METSKYKGESFEVFNKTVERDGETKFKAEMVRRSPGTRLIIVKDDKILLTKEYRFEIGEYDFRLPGGKVYESYEEYENALKSVANIDDDAKKAAIKEAEEEAGIKTDNAKFLHKSICGMMVQWDLYYFLVTNFTESIQQLEVDGDIEINWVNKDKAREMCLNGEMKEERSSLVLLRYLDNKF